MKYEARIARAGTQHTVAVGLKLREISSKNSLYLFVSVCKLKLILHVQNPDNLEKATS